MAGNKRAVKTKYQLSLGLNEVESLDELREETEASSRSEVVREALAVYRVMVDAARKGGAIAIQGQDGRTTAVAIRGLEVARRAFLRSDLPNGR